MADGPRDPSFWLYGEEKSGSRGVTPGRLNRYKCPKCGRESGARSPPRCSRCGVTMRQVGQW